MGYLDYSNETLTNIFPKENFEELVHEVFNVISTNICRSLGPLGSSATILEGSLAPEATKDGYSILDKYHFRNDYKRMIYNLIKAPCTRMNNIVGDGTTTAIALTNALFDRYSNRKSALETMYRLPRQFTKIWDEVIADLQERIIDHATQIDPKDYNTIYNLAYVTSNGNDEVSKAIANVYSEAEAPYIKQKDSLSNKSYIEMVTGFNFPANLISEVYVKNEDMTVEEKDIRVLVFDFKLETEFMQNVVIPINEVCKAKGQKLLVIAPLYDHLMCDSLLAPYALKETRSRSGINMILAQYAMSDLKEHQLEDLCVILRTKVLNRNIVDKLVEELQNNTIDAIMEKIEMDPMYEFNRIIGYADYSMMSVNADILFRVSDDIEKDEIYQSTLNNARNNLNVLLRKSDVEASSYSHKIHNARDRILQLEMKNYIYYVGANSALQKKILWDAITDVIKCVRSAVKTGVVPGCQLSIIKSCDEYLSNITLKYPENTAFDSINTDDQLRIEIAVIIKMACIDVYNQVLNGPDNMGMIKLLPRWQYTTQEGLDKLTQEAIEKASTIVGESIEKFQTFDLETLEFSPDIITSAETDQLVLLAASELVKILISGNQAIIVRADIDSSHEEKLEI